MHADARRFKKIQEPDNRGSPQGSVSDKRQEPVKPRSRLRKYRTTGEGIEVLKRRDE
ncbi:hypothetical protein [Methanolobus psychrotolerans]|uniref:hypothetical protein n=1 Tax=Methanolobus psychrotolerans TaxID=1874706 RepID=UPI0013EDC2DB|nr:hypothetical protein [Methanolobus psychrotolerans]